jgi:hypothetical protein
MSFILIPQSGEDIKVNAWNWRPTLELLRNAQLIDDGLRERMGIHGCRAEIGAAMAYRIAEFLDIRLAAMKPGDRINADLTITDLPKKQVVFTPKTQITDIDAVDLYSATYEWLLTFRDFCRNSGGFKVS